MNTSTTFLTFGQLLTQLPVLLVYVGGLVACAIFWDRAPSAALLAIIGTALMLLSTVAGSALSNYVIQARMSAGSGMGQVSTTLMVISVAGSIVRGVGLALVLAAVFAQRGLERRGFEVPMDRPA